MSQPIGQLEVVFTAYSPASHEAFVKTSWCRGAREPWAALANRLRRVDCHLLVAHLPGEPDSLLGWACVDLAEDVVVWVYVRDLYGSVRRRGLGTSLLSAMGIDVSEPFPCLYWSPAAAEIASGGHYKPYYAPNGHKERACA